MQALKENQTGEKDTNLSFIDTQAFSEIILNLEMLFENS